MNFDQLWNEQGEWSRATFGSDQERGPQGPLKHLQKEVLEAMAKPADVTEFADMVFLIFDACRRNGGTMAELDDDCGILYTAFGEMEGLGAEAAGLLHQLGLGERLETYQFANMMDRWVMACWKAGFTRDQVLKACFDKLAINKSRTWPEPTSNDEPVEHDRSKD